MAGGLLSGKYRRDQKPAEGRHLTDWGEPPVYDEDKLYDIIDELVAVADARGVSAAQVALAWLHRPARHLLAGDRRAARGAAQRQSRRCLDWC